MTDSMELQRLSHILTYTKRSIDELGLAMRQVIEAVNRQTEVLNALVSQFGAQLDVEDANPSTESKLGPAGSLVSQEMPVDGDQADETDSSESVEVQDTTTEGPVLPQGGDVRPDGELPLPEDRHGSGEPGGSAE